MARGPCPECDRRWPRLVGALLLAVATSVSSSEDATLPKGDPEAGRTLYWEGLTRNGEPADISLQGDLEATSTRFPCVSCHRPSGFGTSEGGTFVPPITGPVLFEEQELGQEHRNRLFREFFKESQSNDFDARVRMPRARSAYTENSLARAVRRGLDSEGRALDPAMPRYELDDQAMANLAAYLKTLSSETSPGVGEDTLHLATVVSDDVDPERREAFLSTINRFIAWYNKDIQSQIDNPGFSPFYRSEFKDAYRTWKLHVWELEGDRATWPEQLANQYEAQPAFAMVSGLVSGSFAPVDEFCNAQRLPCVFPNTRLPSVGNPDWNYSLYFSRGLPLEAEALAFHLLREHDESLMLHQIHTDSPEGTRPAQALELYLADHATGASATRTEVPDAPGMAKAIAAAAADAGTDGSSVLALWPGDHLEAAVTALNNHRPKHRLIALPSTALGPELEELSPQLRRRVRITYPYEKPSGYHPRAYRIRAWMHSRGLELTHDRLQMQTFYALTQIQYTVAQLIDDFHRDYLIELIEHEAEAQLNPGVYPSLSLGPGQRFASRGVYIMRLTEDGEPPYTAVSEWLIP